MSTSTQPADWVRAIRDLARRENLTNVLEAIDTEAAAFRRDAIHVVIAGGANSGKSTCINALLARPLLPASSMRSSTTISVQTGEPEQAAIDGQSQPLSALAAISGRASAVDVFVQNEWLRATGIRILERSLDADDETLNHALKTSLRGADLAVLLINALAPVTRVDSAFINECARRGLPLIVTISKADELTPEERTIVAEYAKRYTGEAGLDLTPIDRLRGALETSLASIHLTAVRTRQAKEALLDVLSLLELAAHAGVEAEVMTSAERAEEMKKREQKLQTQNLAWMQIEQRLSVRRQRVDEQVREYLSESRASTLEALYHELERSPDVHQWARELTRRLEQELSSVTGKISGSISRQVAGDLRWLQEELHRQFKYPLSAPLAEPRMEVDNITVAPTNVALANMRTFRVISRVGTAATVVLAGIALAHTGIAGATIAVSSLAGLAADQIAQRMIGKDRSAVRPELDRVVQRAWLDCAAQVSTKLKRGYDELVLSLKAEQDRWNASQVQALRATPSATGSAVDWGSILDQTQTLAAAIGSREN